MLVIDLHFGGPIHLSESVIANRKHCRELYNIICDCFVGRVAKCIDHRQSHVKLAARENQNPY